MGEYWARTSSHACKIHAWFSENADLRGPMRPLRDKNCYILLKDCFHKQEDSAKVCSQIQVENNATSSINLIQNGGVTRRRTVSQCEDPEAIAPSSFSALLCRKPFQIGVIWWLVGLLQAESSPFLVSCYKHRSKQSHRVFTSEQKTVS